MERIRSELSPVYDENARIPILGSFPSVKSRAQGFYYAHPQNRFWRVLCAIFDEPVGESAAEKTEFLLRRRIALWDVVDSCEIKGSSDASIDAVKPNDLTRILRAADIRAILCNGTAAKYWYDKLAKEKTLVEARQLPSTSPANARYSLDALVEHWRREILPYLTDADSADGLQ